MQFKLRLDDLEEIKELPDNLKNQVMEEYKKGYHFLLFYGKFLVVALIGVSLFYMDNFLQEQPWLYKFMVYYVLGHIAFFILKVIEINVVARKVIKDLIKDVV